MKQVFAVYATDNWHSFASRDLIGIATSKQNAIKLCRQQATKDGVRLSRDSRYNLENINQTQEYKGEGELVIEELNTNILF